MAIQTPVPKNAPVYKRAVHLPDPESIDDPDLKAALRECGALRSAAEAAKADATEAGFAIERAEADDRQRAADHARGKLKTKPKPTAPAEVKRAEELGRAASVAALAASDAEAELLELLSERGPALAEKQREQAAAEVTKAHEAAIKVSEHLAARSEHLSLALYLDDPSRPGRMPRQLQSTALQKPSGDYAAVSEILAALIEATDSNRTERTADQRTWGKQPDAKPLRNVEWASAR